jgi:cytoskeletal protein RodZ
MSFGEELRRERELREIKLREVSESTKISLRYLEALERNEFEGLPGGVFNRGFVRAYAEFIGVDPEGMVNAYLLEEQSQSGRIPTERRLLRRGARRASETSPGAAPRRLPGWLRWGLLALLLLAAAAALYFVLRLAAGGAAGGRERSAQDGPRSHAASTAPRPLEAGSGEEDRE